MAVQIGVLLGNLGNLNVAALKYLVVHLNTLQKAFEFVVLPTDGNDPVMKDTSSKERIDWATLQSKLPAFAQCEHELVLKMNIDYNLTQTTIPDKFILLTLARFTDNWYSVSTPGMRVLALGDWESHMAPPSLLEAIVTLILRHAVALISPSLSGSVHLGTKGCLFDFTSSLDEVRFKTLQGFICSDCRVALASDGNGQVVEEISQASNTCKWLGKSEDPSTPAGVVAKLGYDLFLTRGITPSVWERVGATLRDEGSKEIIKIVSAVILAALLLWLGLKRG